MLFKNKTFKKIFLYLYFFMSLFKKKMYEEWTVKKENIEFFFLKKQKIVAGGRKLLIWVE